MHFNFNQNKCLTCTFSVQLSTPNIAILPGGTECSVIPNLTNTTQL